jgi:cytidine deaminase
MDGQAREALAQAALQARANAYAPYSVYKVGAAVLAEGGGVFEGCNVENASFGLTVCAERNAVAGMVCAGRTRLAGIAVATSDGSPPCGACLQVIAEFAVAADAPVLLVDDGGSVRETTLAALLPQSFSGESLKK